MIKRVYETDVDRNEIINEMKSNNKILVEDAICFNEKYLLFIDTKETEPYIIIEDPLGPTPIDLLQEDNASLWYENMVQSARVEANEAEVSDLWYELMQGGM